MRRLICLLAALLLMTSQAAALPTDAIMEEVPRDLREAAEQGTLLESGTQRLGETLRSAWQSMVRETLRGAALLLLVALLCGLLAPLEGGVRIVPLFGVLAAAVVTLGDLDTLLGLGARTADELADLGTLLLPSLAAAMAAGGMVQSASAAQATGLLAANLLTRLIRSLFLPLVYCLAGLSAAEAVLGDERLKALREGLQKGAEWLLCAFLTAFSLYLTLAHVLTGSADRAALRALKLAVSGTIPVIGGALTDAAEGLLGAAQTLRGTVGTLGIFAALALCAEPLLRIAVQYALCRVSSFGAGILGAREVRSFLRGAAGAFALLFGATAACALLLILSTVIAMTAVFG